MNTSDRDDYAEADDFYARLRLQRLAALSRVARRRRIHAMTRRNNGERCG